MFGDQAACLFFNSLKDGDTVLDIGSGKETAFWQMCQTANVRYQPFDYQFGDDWERGHLRPRMVHAFDGVWMCHVLEHLHNVGESLDRVNRVLKPGGVLAVTVPPAKHNIVGGHVSLWNAGILLYRLILAGFDCSEAAVKEYGYNISVVLRKKVIELPKLKHDAGDIEALAEFFPFPVTQGFNGQIEEINWHKV